jgi:hypothetical protein
MNQFKWTTFDVRSSMPAGWEESLIETARRHGQRRKVSTGNVTSREAQGDRELEIRNVSPAVLETELPWVSRLYGTLFLQLAQLTSDEPVSVAGDKGHTTVLNVQAPGDMRYICHVDTNPIQGLLYVTTQPPGTGGELVISNKEDSVSPAEINADCSVIYPQSGHLVFFDGRFNPHYIKPLLRPDDLRVVIAMNYYVPSAPESARPPGLDSYLYGKAS